MLGLFEEWMVEIKSGGWLKFILGMGEDKCDSWYWEVLKALAV